MAGGRMQAIQKHSQRLEEQTLNIARLTSYLTEVGPEEHIVGEDNNTGHLQLFWRTPNSGGWNIVDVTKIAHSSLLS